MTYSMTNTRGHLRNKSGKISKKRLLPFLQEQFGIDPKKVGFEAYGRQVCAYIYGLDGKRREVERVLEAAGCKVDRQWCMRAGRCAEDNLNVASVENIAYFKASHWDE